MVQVPWTTRSEPRRWRGVMGVRHVSMFLFTEAASSGAETTAMRVERHNCFRRLLLGTTQVPLRAVLRYWDTPNENMSGDRVADENLLEGTHALPADKMAWRVSQVREATMGDSALQAQVDSLSA